LYVKARTKKNRKKGLKFGGSTGEKRTKGGRKTTTKKFGVKRIKKHRSGGRSESP